jgi:hypothetical protein
MHGIDKLLYLIVIFSNNTRKKLRLTDGSLFHQSGRVQSYAMQCICQIMTDI